jgi:hypothetical protein
LLDSIAEEVIQLGDIVDFVGRDPEVIGHTAKS